MVTFILETCNEDFVKVHDKKASEMCVTDTLSPGVMCAVCSCSRWAAERACPQSGHVPARVGRHLCKKSHKQNFCFEGKTVIHTFIYQLADNHTFIPHVTLSIRERNFNFHCEYC